MDNHYFLNELETILKKMDYETAIVNNEEQELGDTLRALVPVD